MVSARLTAAVLDAAPVALVALLSAWAFWDFLRIPATTIARLFIGALLVGFAAILLGLRYAMPSIRRGGLVLVVLCYVGGHITLLPLDPAASLAFLTLALGAVELRILAERFAPIFRTQLDPESRERVEEALSRSVLRIVAASALGFFGATLTADLALSGAVPLRSIATALLLSLGLVAVLLLLAFWPLVERRLATRAPAEPLIQTPK